MKKGLLGILILVIFLPLFTLADVWVNGYYRSNGTYVSGHYRSNPDGNPYNNWSYPGNTNPYTGVTATGDPATYLKNYYGSSSGFSGYSLPSTYSSSYYTSYTSPSCPLMASYDSISGTCKCMSGYVASGGSCVSGNSYCWNKYGYGSSYDSLDKTCSCDSGYIMNSTTGQCQLASLYCSSKIGLMSHYNSLTKNCECMSGYSYNGSTCVRVSSASYTSPTYYDSTAYAAALAALSYSTNDQQCQNSYGANSKWDGSKTPEGKLNCSCGSGYTWNSSRTSCVVNYYSTGSTQAGNTYTDDKNTGINYYLKNNTCVGLGGNQYSECILYALNH